MARENKEPNDKYKHIQIALEEGEGTISGARGYIGEHCPESAQEGLAQPFTQIHAKSKILFANLALSGQCSPM